MMLEEAAGIAGLHVRRKDAEQKLQYDLYYVRHQSLVLDLQIVVRTAGRMLSLAGQ